MLHDSDVIHMVHLCLNQLSLHNLRPVGSHIHLRKNLLYTINDRELFLLFAIEYLNLTITIHANKPKLLLLKIDFKYLLQGHRVVPI